MKKWILAISLAFSVFTQASGTVDFLEVDNDVVLFSTTATKTLTSPSCVATESNELWSVSLASHSGRAIYSLILTSMSTGSALSIQSADDCADREGVERASKVSLVAISQGNSAGNDTVIGLYKSDGVTRVGTILERNYDYGFYYADDELITTLKRLDQSVSSFPIYYTEDNCTGTLFHVHNKGTHFNTTFNGGVYMQSEDIEQSFVMKSSLATNGTCSTANYGTKDGYELNVQDHPVCGAGLCLIKSD